MNDFTMNEGFAGLPDHRQNYTLGTGPSSRDKTSIPRSGLPKRVASLKVEAWLLDDGSFEVEIPDFEGGEYARTYADTAAVALQHAGQYVETILFAEVLPGDGRGIWRLA